MTQHIVPDSVFRAPRVYKISVLTPLLGEFQAAMEYRFKMLTAVEWTVGYRNRWGSNRWGSTPSRLAGPYFRAGLRGYSAFEDWFFQINGGFGYYTAKPGYVWDLDAYFEPIHEEFYLQRLDCYSGYGSVQFGKPLFEKAWQVDVYGGLGFRTFTGALYARTETYLATGPVRQELTGVRFNRFSPVLEFNIRVGLRR